METDTSMGISQEEKLEMQLPCRRTVFQGGHVDPEKGTVVGIFSTVMRIKIASL